MQLAQHVCIGLVQRPALLLDGGAPVLKQRDDVVDILRLVGSNAKNRLRSSMDMSATSRIVYRSMLDIVVARMTRRTHLHSSQLEA